MSDETRIYVTNAAWLRQVGRVEAIDDVADGFERPAAPGAEAFWSPAPAGRWPKASRGWRRADRLHPRWRAESVRR